MCFNRFGVRFGTHFGEILGPCWVLFSVFFSFFFRVDFWIVLGPFWGAILGRFWSEHWVKMRICVFRVLLIFRWFFNGFCVSEGVMFVLFRFFFRFVFGIDFWSFFGPISGSFWEAFGGLFGVQIGHFWH